MVDTPLPDPNPANQDDDIIFSDAARKRVLDAYAKDPRRMLSEAAKRRISKAETRAALIRTRASVEAETRYQDNPEQTRILLAEASMAEAREVLPVLMAELHAAGTSGLELAHIMQEWINGLELSLELTGNQRYLLGQELAIYRFDKTQPARSKMQPENNTAKGARSRDETLVALESVLRGLKADGATQLVMCGWLDANNKRPPQDCAWRALSFRAAYQSRKHAGSVRKWLTKHSK
jgi:hypothetical protein